jgi:predicted Zn-dependent peptidase
VILCVPLWASEAESFSVKGLKVIFKQNTASDVIAASVYFRGGAMVLGADQSGLENLALAVAQKATGNYDKERLNAALESMNSQITHAVNSDYSRLSLQCVRQHFDASWEVFMDILLRPAFAEEDIELEREQLLSTIRQRKDDADNYLTDLATEAFFAGHPYAVQVRGREETVGAFTREDLVTYYNNRLETSQLLLVVVGNITLGDLKKMVKSSFKGVPKGRYQGQLPATVWHAESSLKVVERDVPTNYIRGQFSGPAPGTSDNYPMRIAMSILRDRVWEEVRTKRGLSYAPSARFGGNFSNFGYIYVTAVAPDTTIQVMVNEVRRMGEELVSDTELANKVNVIVTRYYLTNETNLSQTGMLAGNELSGAGFDESGKYVDKMRMVTPEAIQAVCQKYMRNLQFVLLGPDTEVDEEIFSF